MRKHARNRVRTRGKRVLTVETRIVALYSCLQSTPKWREWTFRTVSLKQAEAMVNLGEAVPLIRWHEGSARTVGFVSTKPVRLDRPSPTTLTYATMRAVSNRDAGRELTRGECNEILKYLVWPLIGDTKAIAVRPRMTDAERVFAEGLLRSGGASYDPRRAA